MISLKVVSNWTPLVFVGKSPPSPRQFPPCTMWGTPGYSWCPWCYTSNTVVWRGDGKRFRNIKKKTEEPAIPGWTHVPWIFLTIMIQMGTLVPYATQVSLTSGVLFCVALKSVCCTLGSNFNFYQFVGGPPIIYRLVYNPPWPQIYLPLKPYFT